MTTTSIALLATEAYKQFERVERPNSEGEFYVRTKSDAAEWVQDLVRDAHGEFLPDDWRYESIQSALAFIGDADEDDLDDLATEWADQNVDIYTGSRLQWLASNLQRPAYCDEAVDEIGSDGMGVVDMIGLGQYQESLEVWHSVLSSLQAQSEES